MAKAAQSISSRAPRRSGFRELLPQLKQQGLRLTPQRAIILQTVAEVTGHAHLTVQEVYARAKDRLPGLNVATVYRTLEMLHQNDLIDLMIKSNGEVRFSLHDPGHRHCHLVCRYCKQVLEINVSDVASLANKLQKEQGFSIDVDHLTFTGLCSACGSRSRASRR
jgi:Fur family ferric uptake transcriptional regulator